MRQTVYEYIKNKYKVSPEYPWRRYGSYAVFRHTDHNKWFALVMDVPGDKLGLSSTDYVDVINLKVDDLFFRDLIIQEDGIMPAYHIYHDQGTDEDPAAETICLGQIYF